jgi:class IV lanthipeptide synthase
MCLHRAPFQPVAHVAQELEGRWREQTSGLTTRDGFWIYSRQARKGDPVQGWKIHLAATVLSASEVFARALPILVQHNSLFKVPAKLAFLAQLNSGGAGFSQIGKFITIYTNSEGEAELLARKLHVATLGAVGPDIPFDSRYRKNSCVYYRYRAYANGRNGARTYVLAADGKPHLDRRAPGHAVPWWLKDPFNRPRRPNRGRSRHPLGLEFLVHRAFAQRGKGGVFEALDLSTYPARFVVIKQGRRHGDTDWNGIDGYARVKREGKVLRLLHAAGISVPKVLREFTRGGDRYLVLEKISGRRLLAPGRELPTSFSWKRADKIVHQLGPVLSRLHEVGYVWRDCKPAHIFLSRKKTCLIDFEGACRTLDTRALPWGSFPYVPPCYRKEFATRQAGTLEDDYALGIIAFQFLSGQLPSESAKLRRAVYRRTCCPAKLRDRIENLLGY